MSQPNQGVIEETPTFELNPEIQYQDPDLRAMHEQQFPVADEDGKEPSEPAPVESAEPKSEGQEVKDPKAPEPQEKEAEKQPEEPTQEALVAQMIEQVKADLPEPFAPYVEEYYKNDGKLSSESLDKIKEDHGYDGSMVDSFIKTYADNYELKNQTEAAKTEAQDLKTKQEADVFIADLHKQVGGESEWNDMVEWAATEAPIEVLNDYNEYVEHPDPKVVQLAVKNLHSAYESSKPKEPQYLKTTETVAPAPSIRAYVSEHEMKTAFMDQRYGRDPDYTAKVEQRVAATLSR